MFFSCAAARGQAVETQGGHAGIAQSSTPAPASQAANGEVDAAAVRAETLERLKALEPTSSTFAPTTTGGGVAATPVAAPTTPAGARETAALSVPAGEHNLKKSLPALLQDRLRLITAYDAANVAYQKATQPEPSPTQQAADAKAETVRLRTILSLAAEKPDTLLPSLFRDKGTKVSSALGMEMKDAIESTSNEVKDCKNKLETLVSEIASWNSRMATWRSERDILFQRVTALSARSPEFKSAVTDALTAPERRLAQERLVNFEWELRVESLRLRALEAQLALEVKLSEVRDLKAEVYRGHLQVAKKTHELMQKRYSAVADDQERDLTLARADEEKKARLSTDPLEQFRARRTAELLTLEALVLKNEQALVISPPPSYDDQKTLADRAYFDFANIKELLDDGDVSRLDAIRLNNEFRRIGPERDGLLKKEMSQVEAQIQYYENTLTNVELELLQNRQHDRFEHDLLRDRLPPERWAEGDALVHEFDEKHYLLLQRRRRALEKLSEGASHTLVQVTRRLGILDLEYGFIRTTIFWVRDQEPIGFLTITQAARECSVLVKGLLRLVQDVLKPSLWGQPSGEFISIAMAVLVVPIAIMYLRRTLGARIKREMPSPQAAPQA